MKLAIWPRLNEVGLIMDNLDIDQEINEQTFHPLGQKNEAASKFDAEKPRMDLLPFDALLGVASVLSYGAKKYADRDWEQGMSWGRMSGALQRHYAQWAGGEDIDEESGLPHIDHMACCALMLTAMIKRKIGDDDRFPSAVKKFGDIMADQQKDDEPYRPKEGEDARTRDGQKAEFVRKDYRLENPFLYVFEVSGDNLTYTNNGNFLACGSTSLLDLIAPWEGE